MILYEVKLKNRPNWGGADVIGALPPHVLDHLDLLSNSQIDALLRAKRFCYLDIITLQLNCERFLKGKARRQAAAMFAAMHDAAYGVALGQHANYYAGEDENYLPPASDPSTEALRD